MKIRESLRRADWLTELHGLLLVAVVLSGVAGLVTVFATLTGVLLDVEVPGAGVLRPDALVNAGAGVAIAPDASISLQVSDPSGVQLTLAAVSALPSFVLTTVMLVLLWRLVGEARRTDPFVGVTAGRLRTIGWLLVVGGPIAWVVEFMARFALSDTITATGPTATLDLGELGLWFLAGVGFLAIGEVVRRGQAIRAELDQVV